MNTIKKIELPELNDVHYASSLNEVIDNINHNFVALANHDFIKGESGKSIEFVETKFFNDDGTINNFGILLKNCIRELGNIDESNESIKDNVGNKITVWDKFTPETAGCIHLIYNIENDTDPTISKPISSLQYIFMDGRFANTAIGKITDKKQYDNIKDLSCVVVYDNSLNNGEGGFKALTNSISTLYFDEHDNLCWKINGVETGIPAQGISGNNGINSKIYLVKAEYNTADENNNSIGEITAIHDKFNGFTEISELKENEDKYNDIVSSIVNSSAVAFVTNEIDETLLYFGTVTNNIIKNAEEQKLYFIYDTNTSLNNTIKSTEIVNYFKKIDLNSIDADSIKGLFIPINHTKNGNQPVHLISAIYEGENRIDTNDSLDYNDVIITPINDINNLKIGDENKLCVDRYVKFYDVVDGYTIYKFIKYINSKDTFIKYIRENCISIPELDNDILLANLPTEFNKLLENGQKLCIWYTDDTIDKNRRSIFTIDVNPTPNSTILLIEKIDDNNNLVFDTSRRILDFVPEFNNSFKTNDNASLNINYDVNIAKESTKSANLNVNGDLRANQLNLGKFDWFLRPNNNPTNNQLILDNGLSKSVEVFKPTFVINTDTNVNGTITVSNDAKFNGTITVSNDAKFNGNVKVHKDITVNNNAKVNGTANIAGDVKVDGTIISKSIKTNRGRFNDELNADYAEGRYEAIIAHDLIVNRYAKLVREFEYEGEFEYSIENEITFKDDLFNIIKSPLYKNICFCYNYVDTSSSPFKNKNLTLDIGGGVVDDGINIPSKSNCKALDFSLRYNPFINSEKWCITINFLSKYLDNTNSYRNSYVIPSFSIDQVNDYKVINVIDDKQIKIDSDRLLRDFWLNVAGDTGIYNITAIDTIDIVIQSNTQINKLILSIKIDGYVFGSSERKSFISIIPYDLHIRSISPK